MLDKSTEFRVLFDLNVILDVLLKREPHFDVSAKLWALVEMNQLDGWIAAHSLTTLSYLYSKHESLEDANRVIRRILQVFNVAEVDRGVIENAANLDWRDFEDAVQTAAAINAGCDYLITRNIQDFKVSELTVIKPAEFLAIWVSHQEASK